MVAGARNHLNRDGGCDHRDGRELGCGKVFGRSNCLSLFRNPLPPCHFRDFDFVFRAKLSEPIFEVRFPDQWLRWSHFVGQFGSQVKVYSVV